MQLWNVQVADQPGVHVWVDKLLESLCLRSLCCHDRCNPSALLSLSPEQTEPKQTPTFFLLFKLSLLAYI